MFRVRLTGGRRWIRTISSTSIRLRLRDVVHDEELPEDIDDEKYISIPHKRELDLGKPLVLDFAVEFLPDDYNEVRDIFSRRGAYRRYKDLLVRRGALDLWYDFSDKAEEAALRQWCAEKGIDLSGT